MRDKPTFEELKSQITILKNKNLELLKQSENRLPDFLHSVTEMFQIIELIYDDNGEVIDYYYKEVNPAFEKLVDIPREELINKRAKDIFGVVEDYWLRTYDKVEKTGKSTIFENYGAELKKYYKVYAWKVNKNQVAIIFTDITEKKVIENKLTESIEINKSITKSVTEAIITINSNGLIISWNDASEKIFGYTSSEMLNKSLQKIIPTQYIAKHNEVFSSVKKGKLIGKLIEIEALRKGGTKFPIELSLSSWNSASTGMCYTGIIRDISKRKQIESDLIKSKERAEESEKSLIERNKELNGIYSLSQLVDNNNNNNLDKIFTEFINSILPESMQFPKHVCALLEIGKKKYINKANYLLPKSQNYLEGKIITSNKQVGRLIVTYTIDLPFIEFYEQSLINAYSDRISRILERKNSESELMEAKEKAEESDKLKTEFINNMSHEIRTPMNAILGFSGMLNNVDLSNEKRNNFVKIIQSSGYQLLSVIDDILEISRLETKQVKMNNSEICLNDTMLELFSVFDIRAKESKIPLYLNKELSDKQSTILVDKLKLSKVLNNLLENALKYTIEGFVEFGYVLKNNELEFYVKDTGVGIEKTKYISIFERFSQAEKDLSKKTGGLGLGLSIAKENTELLGGTIRLESKMGEGSTFFVTIPYSPVFKDNNILNVGSDIQQGCTILIAEDEEVNYLLLEVLLKDIMDIDCKLIHVKNGKEAVESCKRINTIDLVLMDLKMPIMNGYEAAKQIREFCPNLPIIAQTAYSRPEEKKQANLAGCDDFITKPITQEDMRLKLNRYLAKNLKS